MGFDIRTIVTFSAFNSLFLFFLLLFFLFSGRGNQWYLKTFVLAKTLLTIGIVLVAYRGSIPEFISLVVANILTFAGYNLELFSVTSYDGFYRKKLAYSYGVLTIISSLLFLFVYKQPDYLRVGMMASFSFIPPFLAGIYFVAFKKGSSLIKFMGYAYILTAFIYLTRGIHVYNLGTQYQYMVGEDYFEVFFFITINLSFFLGTVGFVMLLKEKAEARIIAINEELQQESVALKQTNKIKNGFFSIISHDLRGPIGGLMSLGKMMVEETKNQGEDIREMVGAMHNGAKETYGLLNDLLEWANSQRSMEEPEIKDFSITELIESNLQLLYQQAKAKEIKLNKTSENDSLVKTDSRMTNTIIRNLIINAIKFTNKDGEIQIFSEMTDDECHICIKDDGVGMTGEVIAKILSPDQRFTSNGTNNESGTGLGLQLCQELVAKLGGKLWIVSEPNKGSEFWFSLPLADY